MVSFPDRQIPSERQDVQQLPDDQIKVQRQPDGRLLISAQASNGYREWQFYELSKG